VIFKPFYLGCLAHASYLIGDPKTRLAAVVDPQRDVDQYIQEASKRGLRIKHVILTHFHADFVSGHLELRRKTGATIHLGARAKAAYAFHKLRDGDELKMGAVTLHALETPGHTPEAICVLLFDAQRSEDRPHAVLTGDTLFIGDVGRPDLMASVGASAKGLASQLYDSLQRKLLTLPDQTLVYPAHGAGSLCGKNLSSDTVSTIGAQRRYNPSLKPMTRAAFVKLVTTDQPEAPSYFALDAELNRSRRQTLDHGLRRALKSLPLAQFLKRQREGAQVLDTRDPDAFASGHLAGSINVGLGGKFATFAGMILNPGAPILLIARPGQEKESAMRLGRIGMESGITGYLRGGIAAVAAKPELLSRMLRLGADELRRRLAERRPPLVLDVRTPTERKQNAIKGSRHIPLSQLQARLNEIPAEGPLVVHCAGGYRSAMAASLLLAAGRKDVADLEGGMAAWLQVS
jgi:hydroxyacylglutathione hydrolase